MMFWGRRLGYSRRRRSRLVRWELEGGDKFRETKFHLEVGFWKCRQVSPIFSVIYLHIVNQHNAKIVRSNELISNGIL